MIFPFLRIIWNKTPRLHLAFTFPACSSPLIGKKAKARFCLRENYFYYIRNFTFYILHLSFAQARGRQFCHPERSGERKPRAAQSNGSLTFAPLSFRPRRHTPMLSAFCRLAKRSTCKATPPLPKNLASLRFSGALFNSPPSGEILRGAYRVINFLRVRNNFTVLYKIPRLTLGMTR